MIFYIGGAHIPQPNQLVGVLVVVPLDVVLCILSFCPRVSQESTSTLASSVIPTLISVCFVIAFAPIHSIN